LRGVDAKLVLGYRYEWGDDPEAVPLRVDLQARWYMAALDYPVWDIMAVIGTAPCLYSIKRDLDIEREILAAAERFYRVHIVGNTPPEAGASPATTQYIKERFRSHGGIVRPALPAESELLDLYSVARREFDEAETNKEKLQNQLCLAIGEDAGLRSDNCTLTWKRIKDSEKTDWQGLATFLLDVHKYGGEERDRLIIDRTFPKPGYRRIHFTDRRRD
jgi:predicted phage-related endonuclease